MASSNGISDGASVTFNAALADASPAWANEADGTFHADAIVAGWGEHKCKTGFQDASITTTRADQVRSATFPDHFSKVKLSDVIPPRVLSPPLNDGLRAIAEIALDDRSAVPPTNAPLVDGD